MPKKKPSVALLDMTTYDILNAEIMRRKPNYRQDLQNLMSDERCAEFIAKEVGILPGKVEELLNKYGLAKVVPIDLSIEMKESPYKIDKSPSGKVSLTNGQFLKRKKEMMYFEFPSFIALDELLAQVKYLYPGIPKEKNTRRHIKKLKESLDIFDKRGNNQPFWIIAKNLGSKVTTVYEAYRRMYKLIYDTSPSEMINLEEDFCEKCLDMECERTGKECETLKKALPKQKITRELLGENLDNVTSGDLSEISPSHIPSKKPPAE